MDFFAFALQITVTFCGLPIIFISSLITLGVVILQRKQIEQVALSQLVRKFVVVLLICFIVILLVNWLFLIVGTENTIVY
jgi:hypothetical protein